MKLSKLLDSGRKGFPTNSQWADICYLSSLPCSVEQLETIIPFILPENLVAPGIRRYQTSLCQVSPALCMHHLTLSSQIRSVLCARPWRSHEINALSSNLLSVPPRSPFLPLLCSLPLPTKAAMPIARTDAARPLTDGFFGTKTPTQVFKLPNEFGSTEYFGDAECLKQGEGHSRITPVFRAASEPSLTRRIIHLSVLSRRNAWPIFPILI